MQTSLKKWGNSLAIRIPAQILQALDLKEEALFDITHKDGKIILEKKDKLDLLCAEINTQNLNIDLVWEDEPKGKEW